MCRLVHVQAIDHRHHRLARLIEHLLERDVPLPRRGAEAMAEAVVGASGVARRERGAREHEPAAPLEAMR
jgi:hypothetical protein